MGVDYIKNLGGREATFGKITEWKAMRRWLVHTTNRYDEEWQILEAGWNTDPPTFPVPYTNTLGSQPMLLCREIGGKQSEQSPQHWIFTAHYDSTPLNLRDKQQFENPLDRDAAIRWNTAKYNKPCPFDINGKSILNSAGDPFDPPPECDRSRWVATIIKNVPSVPNYILGIIDGVNSVDFTIQGITVPAKGAKVMGIEISDQQSAQISETEYVTYFVFTYSLEFRNELWTLQLQDQGYRQKDPNDSTKRINIKDDSVPPKDISKPWPLNGSGTKLANPSTSNAVSLPFTVYNLVDLGSSLPGLNGNV